MAAVCAVLTTVTVCPRHKYGWICYLRLPLHTPTPQWAMASSFLGFLDHTRQCTTVGRTPLDERSARSRDLYQTTHDSHKRHPWPHRDSNCNLSRRAAADLRHWDWLVTPFTKVKFDTYIDGRLANFSTVPIATFVALVTKLADTPVVVMVTRTHRKWFALLIFPNYPLTYYSQIGFTAISNPCRLSCNYCVTQFGPVSIMRV
jgi:hypothetical protein